ncbi:MULTISPECIES: hypothetical protein [Pseudomonas syringae group]|uniref:Uncharacterized protein n=2 Tax=Pseudomonas amygdali TaxID=47877 RepID=A0AAX1VPF1_PSEAJ|nr:MULTISPECIES: hypothetical protein [Pseudomonas syringae group]KPX74387.1 Uncharacterized protein ALO35_00426 [Pseudomonas amygdali pv. lachrymans]NVL51896.1 hypothetical protein [Pseudomonas syringae pv. actinidiae]KEZ27519.1 hypothetical protein A3SK_0109560 [Pseudomonas amygdali pv. tabaci str. 6605]KIY19325.1 hypothetical protein RD00_07230 [Pseudomonas amygdali pv. tabaci]KPY79841.1 Uncharacterized protein ALO60_00539 [Pseudomonas amygdali pv. tabaci]
MLKSIVSNLDPVLLRFSKVFNGCGFLFIVSYVLLSMVYQMQIPNFDQLRLAQDFAPLIASALGAGAVCMVLQMMIRTNARSS